MARKNRKKASRSPKPSAAPSAPAEVLEEPSGGNPHSGSPAPWLTWLRSKLSTERRAVGWALLLGALLFLPFLGTLGLWDPWETHYGEVAREMIVRRDWLYPHWEQAYFFSKPALPMWLMAAGMSLFGAEGAPYGQPLGPLTEWGVRLPFALIAIAAMWAVYRVGRQLKDRATGMLALLVLGSSAQFIFIGKQSMVDMPLVGFMSIGLSLFIGAVFDEAEDRPASRWELGLALGGFTLGLLPQLLILALHAEPDRTLSPLGLFLHAGIAVKLVVIAAIAFFLFSFYLGVRRWLRPTRRDCYLMGFYVLTGLAFLAKGLAVLAVVGPTVVLYMLLSRDFDVLRRSGVLWGAAVFVLIAAPWYVALSLFLGRDDEGKTFAERFWLHDNFNRVGVGVHGDRAGLGYYIEQLSYGMFPWIAVLPFSLARAAVGPKDWSERRRQALLFVLVWGAWCYAFFTLSETKFHHYIFPALPAFAVLIGVWLSELAEAPDKQLKGYLPVLAAVIFLVAARDLINTPRHLVSLFTYKYDREWPREISPRIMLSLISVGGGLAVAALFFLKRRAQAILAFIITGVVFGVWVSHVHFNMLSPHWSQYHLFDTYYEEKRGTEPIYAYQMNWRGETFYSRNTTLQIRNKGANRRIRELINRPGREFIILERKRLKALKNALSADKRDKLEVLDNSSTKFCLVVVKE